MNLAVDRLFIESAHVEQSFLAAVRQVAASVPYTRVGSTLERCPMRGRGLTATIDICHAGETRTVSRQVGSVDDIRGVLAMASEVAKDLDEKRQGIRDLIDQ